MVLPDGQLEWLETNALGSFCLCSVDRKLRRKYHALLTVRDPGRGDAWNLLADVRERLEVGGQSALLADPLTGRGEHSELLDFRSHPHASHTYRAGGVEIERRVRLGANDQIELRYAFRNVRAPLRLGLSPLLRCRPLHELTHENPFLDGACVKLGDEARMLPYAGMPALAFRVFGAACKLEEQGSWVEAFYEWEAERGYPARESLFTPGCWQVDIDADTSLTFVIGLHRVEAPAHAARHESSLGFAAKLASGAARFFMRGNLRAAAPRGAAELGERGADLPLQTIVAGFPWFGASSRDALIALPGMYLASGGDFERAEAVLEGLARARGGGLLPDTLAFGGAQASGASVDGSLLFARTVQWFARQVGEAAVERFMPVVCELLEGLADGAEPRARFDQGVGVWLEPGPCALTWMGARIDGVPVTPRSGHAVDIDALAYNAAHFACEWAELHRAPFARAFRTRLRSAEADFTRRYWDDARGYLADAHDGQRADPSLRPNQLWALGLPFRPVPSGVARASLEAVRQALLVPAGLRTLAPHDPAYHGHYGGSQAQRDGVYHQGSAFPWLMGIYAEAVLQQLGREALAEQLGPFFSRMIRHLDAEACIGQVSELFDGDAPHAPGGAPAQASSIAEVYRALRMLQQSAQPSSTPRSHGELSGYVGRGEKSPL